MWPFNQLGSALGSKLQKLIAGAFETAMQALWDAALFILREAFQLADRFSVFTVSTTSGAVSVLWPMMLWTSGVLALGLFFWQLTMTSLRSGRGFMRVVTGPVQYGIALAVTVSVVASMLAGTDGLTDGILEYGLQSENFSDALQHTSFADGAVDGVKAVVLGICAFVGVIPAGIGYVLEMLFREAAVYVLVATIPITAAGLLANVTVGWFWKTARWMLACIAMKPVLALTLVLGVAISGGAKGLSGLLSGVGVLIISLLCPFVLFRLFAFVDPNSDSGAAFRDALSSVGIGSYGSGNPAMQAAEALADGGGRSGSAADSGSDTGGNAQEAANTGRFDEATADYADEDMSTYGVGSASGGDGSGQGGRSSSSGSASGSSESDDSDTESGSGETSDSSPRPAANQGQVVASNGVGPVAPQPTNASGESSVGDNATSGGGGSSNGGFSDGGEQSLPPEPPDPGGHDPSDDDGDGSSSPRGGGGPKSSGGGGGAAAAGEADAAVIV